jgi:hypothetical protein
MKFLTTAILSMILLFSFPLVGVTQSADSDEVLKDVLLTILNPEINTAITGYYGKPRQYGLYDAEIINIFRDREGGFTFRVKVLVKTFVGPHNPPYGNETLLLTIDPAGAYVEEFIHQDG